MLLGNVAVDEVAIDHLGIAGDRLGEVALACVIAKDGTVLLEGLIGSDRRRSEGKRYEERAREGLSHTER